MSSPYRIKRIYAPPSSEDGQRVLIDRLWPRGISREKAELALWLPEVAPSDATRQKFAHRPENWDWFQKRYCEELVENTPAIARLQEMAGAGRVTLLFAARDEQLNNAVVLKDFLDRGREVLY